MKLYTEQQRQNLKKSLTKQVIFLIFAYWYMFFQTTINLGIPLTAIILVSLGIVTISSISTIRELLK